MSKKENVKEDNKEDKENNSNLSQSLNSEDESSNKILNEEDEKYRIGKKRIQIILIIKKQFKVMHLYLPWKKEEILDKLSL